MRLILPGEENRERIIELTLFLLSIIGIAIVGAVIL